MKGAIETKFIIIIINIAIHFQQHEAVQPSTFHETGAAFKYTALDNSETEKTFLCVSSAVRYVG